MITGLGVVTGLGLGAEAFWSGLLDGRSAIEPIKAFDASGFEAGVAAEVPGLEVRKHVPKSYRKATKVMARDIELAVVAADLAAADAGLVTKGTDPDAPPSHDPDRVGAHIGAGLIAADLDELTAALAAASDAPGTDDAAFDMSRWGSEGMTQLTPLWLLKYLPNMLACHVTIIHDARGPSNTITCNEASGGLSIGESLRVIQRGAADACFCGGAESKLNPMAFLRQQFTGRLAPGHSGEGPRPFDHDAAGMVIGEGGGLVVLETASAFKRRGGESAYARVLGFAGSQSVHREAHNLQPEPDGRGLASAVRRALAEAGGGKPVEIDLVVAFGCGVPAWDAAEAAALRATLGEALPEVPVVTASPAVGSCGAGQGAVDVAVASLALRDQMCPPVLNRDAPLEGLIGTRAAQPMAIERVLVTGMGLGGQNTAIVLGRA